MVVRTEYAKWWDLKYPAQDRLDEIRQRLESGNVADVTLVNVHGTEAALDAADALQDVCGEHFIGANDSQQLLVLRSQAWTLERAENLERFAAVIAVLEEALEIAHRATPQESVRLAHKTRQLLVKFPSWRLRFQQLESALSASPRQVR